MCTALTLTTKDFYCGRTLDLEYSYQETVTVLPRNFPLRFRRLPQSSRHYAMIGMAYVSEGYPLFYDAVNEKGLCMAGLNFPQNARYFPERADADNVAPFEFIPYLLSQCATLEEARKKLARVNLTEISFSEGLPLSPLHWIVSDATGSVVVESTKDGMRVYEDPAGVLTNNPTFDAQLLRLADYSALSPSSPKNVAFPDFDPPLYSRGMGALGLPGDWSSPSRFARAAFLRAQSVCGESEEESVGQFFHILDAVAMPRGSVLFHGKHEITVYASCCNAVRGIYYYTTYEDRCIHAVDMHAENLEGDALSTFDLSQRETIVPQNGRQS